MKHWDLYLVDAWSPSDNYLEAIKKAKKMTARSGIRTPSLRRTGRLPITTTRAVCK